MPSSSYWIPGRVPAVLLLAQLVGAMVDFGALGLTSASGFDKGKWLALSPGLAFGLYLLMASPILMRWLLAGPAFLLTLWFAWALAGVLWSVDAQSTLLQTVLALTTMVSSFWYVRSFGRVAFARVFCVAAGIVVGVGLANDLIPQVAAVLPIEISQTQFGLETGRSPGLTPGVNQLGMLSGVTMMMLVRSEPRNLVERAARFGLFAGAVLAMLTAGSRSVAVCTIAALAVQQGINASPSTRRRSVVAVAAGLFLTVGLIGASGTETTFQAGRSFDSLNGRSDVWAYAFDVIASSPLTGVGMMSGQVTWSSAFTLGRTSFDAGDAHNMALELLIGTGTVGLALFGVALGWACLRSWRGRDADALALLILIGFVGLTEALVSAAGLVYALLGLVMGLVAVESIARPWPSGRGGNPDLLGEQSQFESAGSLA